MAREWGCGQHPETALTRKTMDSECVPKVCSLNRMSWAGNPRQGEEEV